MKQGAIAFMDALGFKGKWRPPQDTSALLLKMQNLAAAAREVKERKFELGVIDLHREVRCFSDTIIIGCHAELTQATKIEATELKVAQNLLALQWVIGSCAFTIAVATTEPPPLTYRGAIAVGEFDMADDFVLGPAIDEAAEAEHLAQGAFVWLCPSALRLLSDAKREDHWLRKMVMDMPTIADYRVPLKGGDSLVTDVVDPFWFGDSANMVSALSSFDSPQISVLVKKQNTEAFYRVAERHRIGRTGEPAKAVAEVVKARNPT